MFDRLITMLTGRDSEPEVNVLERAELIADANGILTVRLRFARLGVRDFQQVVDRLQEAGCEAFDLIRFDLSRVKELVGPWGAHFAMLIRLGRDVRGKIRMTGLHGQAASVAWLFRNSREVCSLLDGPEARTEETAEPQKPRQAA